MSGRAHEKQICPHCGASFKRGKLACPECGSDENTGWQDSEEIAYRSVDLPDVLGADEPGRTAWISRRAFVVIAFIVVLAMLLNLLF